MLKRFGTMLWTQQREIYVYNYAKTVVYVIDNNNKYIYISLCKETGVVLVEPVKLSDTFSLKDSHNTK